MKVITISGHAQHGKDTVAKMLDEKLTNDGHTVLVTHFADLLKYICKTFFGWNGKKDENGREILQYVGTNVIRERNPDYWVSFISDILSYFSDKWEYVIIPDTRFPNEIDRLREKGLDVIHMRVNRDGFINNLTPEQRAHPSETALNDVNPDYFVVNNGSIDELRLVIRDWIDEYLYDEVQSDDEEVEEAIFCPYCGEWNGHPDGVQMEKIDEYLDKFYVCPNCDCKTPSVLPKLGESRESVWRRAHEAALRMLSPTKTGETVWVDRGGNRGKFPHCSVCGNRKDDRFLNYCPSCGAKDKHYATEAVHKAVGG